MDQNTIDTLARIENKLDKMIHNQENQLHIRQIRERDKQGSYHIKNIVSIHFDSGGVIIEVQ